MFAPSNSPPQSVKEGQARDTPRSETICELRRPFNELAEPPTFGLCNRRIYTNRCALQLVVAIREP